jgi:hypothetical protein
MPAPPPPPEPEYPPGSIVQRVYTRPDGALVVETVIPLAVLRGAPPPPAGAVGSSLEEAILQALAERPAGEYPKGEDLAVLAGYPFHSRFREALASLRRRGVIVNHDPGYGLPDR